MYSGHICRRQEESMITKTQALFSSDAVAAYVRIMRSVQFAYTFLRMFTSTLT